MHQKDRCCFLSPSYFHRYLRSSRWCRKFTDSVLSSVCLAQALVVSVCSQHEFTSHWLTLHQPCHSRSCWVCCCGGGCAALLVRGVGNLRRIAVCEVYPLCQGSGLGSGLSSLDRSFYRQTMQSCGNGLCVCVCVWEGECVCVWEGECVCVCVCV